MKNNKFIKLIAFILIFATLALSCVSCVGNDDDVASESESETPRETLPFVPPPFDEGAEQYEPTLDEIPELLGYSIIYDPGRMSYKVGFCGYFLINSENKADIYFTNPSVNGVWLKLRIYSKANPSDIVCETGLIRPGETLKTVEFNRPLADEEEIVVKVMSYVPETYYSSGVIQLQPYVMNEKAE